MKLFFFESKRESAKKYFKVGNGKIKKKTFFVLFLNACSILELMLCNQNLTKLVYQTLLSSNCWAWALKLSENLKKWQFFLSKLGSKGQYLGNKKITINQCRKNVMRKKTFFCKNVLLYTINNISMVLEIIIIKFSCIFKTMSRNTIPEPQPDSAS